MNFLDLGNVALWLVGKKILTDDELYLVKIEEEQERTRSNFRNFKIQLREQLIGSDDFVLGSFHLIEATVIGGGGWQIRGCAVSKILGIADQYFSVSFNESETNNWTRIPKESVDSIISEVTKVFAGLKGKLYDKEDRDDVQDEQIKD